MSGSLWRQGIRFRPHHVDPRLGSSYVFGVMHLFNGWEVFVRIDDGKR